jgi:acetylornithine/N-succinyldiaminopimelate aminotransferase
MLRQQFFDHIAQTSPEPLALQIARAEGIYLYDQQGKAYIDLIAGISVSNLGHSHPEIVAAVCRQAQTYMHLMVYGEYVEAPQVQLATLLCQQLPPQLNNVYLLNSGAEAVEAALKLAKRHTKRSELIGFTNAYHGSTHGALSLMGSEQFRQAFRPTLPNVRHLSYNNFDHLAQITEQTACVIVEPIQAEAGIIKPLPHFLPQLRQRCTEVGALLILDEIQTGYGRTGTLFAFEQQQIIPDILLLAKAFGGGMPLGAVVANRNILSAFTHQPILGHITTFGGHPVSCAAAHAALQILLREKIYEQANQKSQLFEQHLQHPRIKNIRRAGLLIALELDGGFAYLQKVVKRCIENGVIIDWFLFADNCLRIAPPLTIDQAAIEKACYIIKEALSAA